MAGRTGRPVARIAAFWGRRVLSFLSAFDRAERSARLPSIRPNDAVVWWATPVEIASALARLLRIRELDAKDWAKASKLAKDLAHWWSVIQPSDALRAT